MARFIKILYAFSIIHTIAVVAQCIEKWAACVNLVGFCLGMGGRHKTYLYGLLCISLKFQSKNFQGPDLDWVRVMHRGAPNLGMLSYVFGLMKENDKHQILLVQFFPSQFGVLLFKFHCRQMILAYLLG